MYKRRLPSFVAYLLLELTTCVFARVLALIPEKRRERGKKGRKEKETGGTNVQDGKHRAQSTKGHRVI